MAAYAGRLSKHGVLINFLISELSRYLSRVNKKFPKNGEQIKISIFPKRRAFCKKKIGYAYAQEIHTICFLLKPKTQTCEDVFRERSNSFKKRKNQKPRAMTFYVEKKLSVVNNAGELPQPVLSIETKISIWKDGNEKTKKSNNVGQILSHRHFRRL